VGSLDREAPTALTASQVQLWAVHLEASEDRFSQCLSWLSSDETARAARFHFAEHRRAFVLGRGVLRALLGGFLEMPPGQIQFSYGPKGKPVLADSSFPIRFNASNSGNYAVYAFTEGCDIGIDVEQVRPIPEMEHIAERFFAPAETSELMALPEPDHAQAFFNCWTRKEAYIKAVGDGLSVPLDSFRVTLRPGAAAEMLCLGGSIEAAKGWTMHDLAPAPGFVGAIAYAGRSRAIVFNRLVTVDELLAISR
jgi:4'-phosphopantetheinyl transferase